MHPHPRAANSKPQRRLSVSFPRTLLPGPQPPPPPRCPASSAAESSGRLARGSRVSWPNGDWTWRQIASGCGRFTTATSSPGTGRPTTGPKGSGGQRRGGGGHLPAADAQGCSPGPIGPGRSWQTSSRACPRPASATPSPPALHSPAGRGGVGAHARPAAAGAQWWGRGAPQGRRCRRGLSGDPRPLVEGRLPPGSTLRES